MSNHLSPEQHIVLDCVRFALDGAADPGGSLRVAGEQVDWAATVDLAIRQGVASVVYAGAKALELELSDRERAILRMQAVEAATRSQVWLTRTLGAALAALDEVGIEPIVLKGAALAHTVYPQSWYRSLSDVDLLMPRKDLIRAGEALRQHGFVVDEAFLAAFPKVEHHLPPHFLPGSPVAVELHHQLLSGRHPYRIDVDGIRARAVEATLAGRRTRVPAPVDALHHTCVHLAFAHRYDVAPLRGFADILAMTLAWSSSLDWDELVRVVRSSRTGGAVFWPLLMASTWLDAPVPGEVLKSLAPPAWYRALLKPFADATFILEGRVPTDRENLALLGLLRDVSLRSGCPPWVQAAALWQCIFRSPEDVGHLPSRVRETPLRYLAFLLHPKRLSRGVLAASRLFARPGIG